MQEISITLIVLEASKEQTKIRKFPHTCKRLSMGVNMITKMARGDQDGKCCTR